MRAFILLAVAFAIPTVLLTGLAFSNEGGVGPKTPLDLPAGGVPSEEEEEENAPETILFYGTEFEGDGFFWCFPAYGFCGETTAYDLIKQEINTAVSQLSSRSRFSMVGFNSETYIWSPSAVRGTPTNKSSAMSWMETLPAIEAHCLLDAALTTLQISQMSRGQAKTVIILGARAPYCDGNGGEGYIEECLTSITGANFENSPINTMYVSSAFYSGEGQFYEDLAEMNLGSYQEIEY